MSDFRLEFYQTLATIIPVLLLAITIQSGNFIKQAQAITAPIDKFIQISSVCGVVLLLMLSESFILHAIYNNSEDHVGLIGIFIAMGIASAFILVDYILAILSKTAKGAVVYWLVLCFTVIAAYIILSTIKN